MQTRVLMSALLLVTLSTTPTWASWNWTNLHPDGSNHSYAQSISDRKIGGYCTQSMGDKAVVWDMQSGSRTDITPPGARDASVRWTSSNSQVGIARIVNQSTWHEENHAALWHDTAGSFVDLHPSGYMESEAWASSGDQQVGYATVYVEPSQIGGHAGVWTGTADSWVDLNPAGSLFSYAWAVCNGKQGGAISRPEWRTGWGQDLMHAGLWSGTAESWVDINPAGALNSGINGMDSHQQVGSAAYVVDISRSISHAGYWQGTTSSWVDLHPATAYSSTAIGVSNGWQAGIILDKYNQTRASIWQGTASSWQDLHRLLPSYYTYSWALGIEASGNDVWVVGFARNGNTNRDEAMLWHQTVPEPGSLITVIMGLVSLSRVARYRRK